MVADSDMYGAVPAGRPHELLGRRAGSIFDPPTDREGGEYDGFSPGVDGRRRLTVGDDGGSIPVSYRTHRLSGLPACSMIRGSTSCLNALPPSADGPNRAPHTPGTARSTGARTRGGDLQRAASGRAVVQSEVELAVAGGNPLPRRRLGQFDPGLAVRGPDMLDDCDLRREEYTICTTVAPGPVLTVHTYGTRHSLGAAGLVHAAAEQPKVTTLQPGQPRRGDSSQVRLRW